MALIYEKGTISQMGEITTGVSKSGRTWSNRIIVVDFPGYNGSIRKVAMKANADKETSTGEGTFKVGDAVEVGYSVSSREYNGKWYHDVIMSTIRSEAAAAMFTHGNVPTASPSIPAPAKVEKPVTEKTDDLPF